MSSQLRLSGYGALATMATALSLLSVFQTTGWFVPVMGAILLVAGACALVRMSPLPSAFEPICAAVAVLLWITGLYARDSAHAAVLPGQAAFRSLGDTARTGFTEIHNLPTPAPPHHGLVMLTVVGVAAIALVVDLMTVTLRRAALAGLPLLALFTVCAATGHHGVHLVSFVTSAVGYLWLLYADNRDKVSRWGAAVGSGSRARPASTWSTDPSSAPPPASLGRQVGAAAIGLGLVVPLFIPGLHTGIGKRGGGAGSGRGGGVVKTFNPIVRIGAQLESSHVSPILTYTTTSSNPGYIRLTSLDQFDGYSFTQGNLTAGANQATSEHLPVRAPVGATVQTDYQIAGTFIDHWLPVTSTALGISLGEPWRYDPGTSTIFSAARTTSGLHYTERSVPNEPTSAQLQSAGKPPSALDADLTLPTIATPVRVLEQHITRNATSRYDAAVAIQRYLTSDRFSYDTTVPPDRSEQALYNFLFNNKRGFCQQFATAMAVMARLHGIPSRIAVGFTAGKQRQDGSWLVTTKDAHAWPELWFQGYGWLPFEPTPRGDGQAVTPPYAKPASAGGGKNNKNNGQDVNPRNLKNGDKTKQIKGENRHGQTVGAAGGRGGGSGSTGSMVWVAVALLAGLLVVPGTARSLLRRRRWRRATDPSLAPILAWAEMRDTVVDRSLPWDDKRTPREIARALLYAIDATPKTSDAMLRLARYEEESRYAPPREREKANLKYDVDIVRTAIDVGRPRRARVRTAVLPRSMTIRAKQYAGDGFGWMQAAMHRLSPMSMVRARTGG